jgi:SAM-dependent methyltransferase
VTPSPGAKWDRRFAAQGWPEDPDPFLVEFAGDLPPGKGLDLGSGPGRNSLWLAARGWQMTLVDASKVGLEQAAAKAKTMGVAITTVHADLSQWQGEPERFDLAIVANLHPSPEALAAIFSKAADALRSAGHLYVVGHHVSGLGRHGPPDPERLFTSERLCSLLPRLLEVEVLETRERRAGHGRSQARDADQDAPDQVVLAWARKLGPASRGRP